MYLGYFFLSMRRRNYNDRMEILLIKHKIQVNINNCYNYKYLHKLVI